MADPAPPALPTTALTTVWETAKDDAGVAWDYYESPVTDVAAVIGVEAAWLTVFLLALKAVGTGLWMEFKKLEKK